MANNHNLFAGNKKTVKTNCLSVLTAYSCFFTCPLTVNEIFSIWIRSY